VRWKACAYCAAPGAASASAWGPARAYRQRCAAQQLAQRGATQQRDVPAVHGGLPAQGGNLFDHLVHLGPLARPGERDVGAPHQPLHFLVGPDAGYVTGIDLLVDGGFAHGLMGSVNQAGWQVQASG
jgi:NAD(P)-dependent dehydrogenase (short-subunit alcohol dehydrogenase family)